MKTLTFSSACAREYMQQGAKSFLCKRFHFQKIFFKKIRKFGIKVRPATYSIVKKEIAGATPQEEWVYMKIINENIYITWCEDTTWCVSELFEGEWYHYYMDADEIEAEWGDVWQC